MILEQQKEATVLSTGKESDSIKMSLDLDSAQVLMQMLSKNLYSDSIGSTIRECASNALDSHRRLGIKKPIIVGLHLMENNNFNYEFSVEDFGTGLDADDVENIISKYGKSTKRNSDTELGMMGLGFKAPLAYSSSFYFVCRKNGVERKYMMYEGEDTNTIDLLYEKTTEEPNGVKVIVPVKYGDRYIFFNKIQEQLAYFEDVFFNVDVSGSKIDNSFKIYRDDNFQYSELCKTNQLHLCLDNVYYPLDFQKLGINTINCNVALRFSLKDGIYPTPNRESIRYTQEAKAIILQKLEKFSTSIVKEYNKTILESEDVKSVIKFFDYGAKNISFNNINFNVTELLPFSKVSFKNPKLKGIKTLDLKNLARIREYILINYAKKHSITGGIFKDIRANNWKYRINPLHISDNYCMYEETILPIKKMYLKDYFKVLKPNTEIFFLRKTHNIRLGNSTSKGMNTYYELLNLHKVPREEWREHIKEFQQVQQMLLKPLISIDNISIDQKWLDDQKANKSNIPNPKKTKGVEELVSKLAVPLERDVYGKNCKFISHYIKMKEIRNLHVYTTHDNASALDGLFEICLKNKVNLVTFSQRELKLAENLKDKNLISLEEFMKGETKQFKRIVTAGLIHRLSKEYKNTFEKFESLRNVNTNFANKLEALINYHSKHYVKLDDKNFNSLHAVAQKHNLFDYSIYTDYLYIKEKLEKLYFLEVLLGSTQHHYTKTIGYASVIADLFKYNKEKVNINHYKTTLKEE